ISLLTPIISYSQHQVAFVQVSALNNRTNNPNRTVVSANFELREGLILVEGHMNGELGYFIFDTGAPMMIVNKTDIRPNDEELAAAGITTAVAAEWLSISNFQWANIEQRNLSAVAIDISHLERATDRRILGLIGYELLKSYEVLFDYNNHIVRLFPARNNALHNHHTPVAVLDFKLRDHVPVLEVNIGGRVYRMGLDSGSETNILSSQIKEEIPAIQFNGLRDAEVQGVDQVVHSVTSTLITSTNIAEHNFEKMKYLFTDIQHLHDLQMDGLLGFPFFKQKKCSINYKKGKLYFWE
ncbi:MAG: aspartyl protease family protein, partial [Bacteroidota bacterium]